MIKLHQEHTIVSAELVENGDFEVVKKYPSNMTYCNGKRMPDKVIKEIYRSESGVISKIGEVTGQHTPAYMIQEKIEF